MHAQRGNPERVGQAVGDGCADEQRAGEPGPFGVRDGGQRLHCSTGLFEQPARSGSRRRMWSREASSGTTPP